MQTSPATKTSTTKMTSLPSKTTISNKSSTAGAVEDFLTGKIKANPNLDKGRPMPVMFQTDESGRVSVVMTAGLPPDTIGFNLNRAAQKERKTSMVAKLRMKLEAKRQGKV